MSAQPHPTTTSDATDEQIDPHGIVPEDFVDAYDADSIPEALANAEQAPSTTAREDMGQCPACRSVRLSPKPGLDSQHDRAGTLVCTGCRAHLGVPGGAGSFEDSAAPTVPTREIIPVTIGSANRYHVADGCAFTGGAVETVTAAEVVARGLEPCQHDACQPAAEWRACDHCGQPTFGAVEGIPLAVCADCVEVDGDD
jgi:hypothetical protein